MRKPSFPPARKIYKVQMYGINRYRAGTARIYACGDSRLRGHRSRKPIGFRQWVVHEHGTIENFFQKVRMKEPYCLEQWNTFLTDLAKAINMLHLVYDTDFILGGYISQYLCDEDLGFIHEKIQQMTPFTEEQDFLRISKMPEHNISIGAALPYIQAFLNNFGI